MHRTVEEERFLDEKVYRLGVGRAMSSMFEIALDLDLFSKIQGRSVTLEELADLLSMPLASTRLMTQFLCREGLLIYRDGKLSNAPAVDKFLAQDTLVGKEIRSLRRYPWPAAELKERLMKPTDRHAYQTLTDEQFYYNNNPRRVAWGEEIAHRYDFGPHRVLLDVAGSSGGFCIGIRKHNPHLRCILFDLPKSQPFAEKVIADAGQSEHISFVGGSFLTDELPRGADVAIVANVIHNWPPEDDLVILRKIHDALEPGGTLLVFEFFFEDDWTGPLEAVFQAFILSDRGWQPSYGEVERLMTEVGFTNLERRYNLLIGRKQSA
jgi:ubiquinone/menaquinone biosynthesis C-methylase UbiE